MNLSFVRGLISRILLFYCSWVARGPNLAPSVTWLYQARHRFKTALFLYRGARQAHMWSKLRDALSQDLLIHQRSLNCQATQISALELRLESVGPDGLPQDPPMCICPAPTFGP